MVRPVIDTDIIPEQLVNKSMLALFFNDLLITGGDPLGDLDTYVMPAVWHPKLQQPFAVPDLASGIAPA